MPEVILTVGIPASGKSTWARTYAFDHQSVIVCRDDIRATYGFTYDLPKDRIAENEQFVTEVQRMQIEIALACGKDVVVADTNIDPKHRRSLIKFCHEHGADVTVIPFPISLDEAITRDNNRTAKVGADVIVKMYQRLQSQNIEEEFHPAPKFDNRPVHNDDKQYAIVVDIDGTVAHNVSRDPYDETKVSEDEPIQDVIEVIKALSETFEVVFVSGRKDSCRDDTAAWILKHMDLDVDKTAFSGASLFMRKHTDNRPDYVIKAEIYDQYVFPYFNVVMVFDDRDQVVRHIRARGITVAQVALGRF